MAVKAGIWQILPENGTADGTNGPNQLLNSGSSVPVARAQWHSLSRIRHSVEQLSQLFRL